MLRFRSFFAVDKVSVALLVISAAAFIVTLSARDASATIYKDDSRAKVDSGDTQVLAKIGKREITINELRIEMMRLGIREATVETERFAMQSIINRHVLIEAAKTANFHRKPDAALQMKAARDQALADYFLVSASQAAEPTLSEIEDYIASNPGLFAKRTRYEFLVLSMPSSDFDVDSLTPLFSETSDFSTLKAALDKSATPFAEKPLVQASSSFAREIRQQLAAYSVNDNIVIKTDEETQIMKILDATPSPLPSSEWRAIARRLVMEQNSVNRARSLLDSLKVGNSVIFYRPDLAPVQAPAHAPGKASPAKTDEVKDKPTKTPSAKTPGTTGK